MACQLPELVSALVQCYLCKLKLGSPFYIQVGTMFSHCLKPLVRDIGGPEVKGRQIGTMLSHCLKPLVRDLGVAKVKGRQIGTMFNHCLKSLVRDLGAT